VFVGYGNGGAPDGSGGTVSNIIVYDFKGNLISNFVIAGHNDGLRFGNASVTILDPRSGEFSYELLKAVSARPDRELQAALAKLVDTELIYARGFTPERDTNSNMLCSGRRLITLCSRAAARNCMRSWQMQLSSGSRGSERRTLKCLHITGWRRVK
jgi:hypothetical protein